MKKQKSASKRRWWTGTFLLSILFFLSFSACRARVTTKPVPIGAEKIAGKITAGIVAFEPGEDPAGNYYIVTPAFVLKTAYLAMENDELKLEVKKLRAIIEGKKGP